MHPKQGNPSRIQAALVATFPGIPVTLFESADWVVPHQVPCLLWPSSAPSAKRLADDPNVVSSQTGVDATSVGQGVLLVTEPHSELNAGFTVIFASAHPPFFDVEHWKTYIGCLPDGDVDQATRTKAAEVSKLFWARVGEFFGEFLGRTLTEFEMTDEEKQVWIQTGLALSPLPGTCLQYSVDFAFAWALIGEWTSRVLFPVPAGDWPRHGHPLALLEPYSHRAPFLVTWARACFQQGALPSLLYLPGLVPIFTLPGDKMFQSTGIQPKRQRPAILHAYGGAKIDMEKSLMKIAPEGWAPLVAAMVGTTMVFPWLAACGWNVAWPACTTYPYHTKGSSVLLVSCSPGPVQGSALATWLTHVNDEFGPECQESPHFVRPSCDELESV